jgi:hypothetical protein
VVAGPLRQPGPHLGVLVGGIGPQHQPGTGHQGMGQGARGGQASQLGLLVGSQGDGWLGRPVRMHGMLTPDQLLTLVIYGTQH